MAHSKKLDNNQRTRITGPQLCDWDAKKSLLRALLGVGTDKPLVETLTSSHTHDPDKEEYEGQFADRLYNTFSKWHDGVTPSGEGSLFLWSQIRTDFTLTAPVEHLWTCSIVEFVEFFSGQFGIKDSVTVLLSDPRVSLQSDTKVLLQRLYQSKEKTDVASFGTTRWDEYELRSYSRGTFTGPQTGLQNGHILSSQFYAVPEAAHAWFELVDSQNYHMYMDCLRSLKRLVQSEHWHDAIGYGQYNAAVIFGGGGSPEKDWVLAESICGRLESDLSLDYVINDISPYMADGSLKVLVRRVGNSKLKDRIRRPRGVCFDFLLMDEVFPRESDWKSVVWAILGGTIGNISERDFFRALGVLSKVGDLLIVGLDTIGIETPEAFDERMKAQYRSKELDTLLLTHLKHSRSGSVGNAPIVEVSVVTHEGNHHTNIPGSWTAVFSSPSLGESERETVLATSTRYVLDEFLQYAERFHWEYLGNTSAHSESTFRQLLLRRIK